MKTIYHHRTNLTMCVMKGGFKMQNAVQETASERLRFVNYSDLAAGRCSVNTVYTLQHNLYLYILKNVNSYTQPPDHQFSFAHLPVMGLK